MLKLLPAIAVCTCLASCAGVSKRAPQMVPENKATQKTPSKPITIHSGNGLSLEDKAKSNREHFPIKSEPSVRGYFPVFKMGI